jgi:hypothetical protein
MFFALLMTTLLCGIARAQVPLFCNNMTSCGAPRTCRIARCEISTCRETLAPAGTNCTVNASVCMRGSTCNSIGECECTTVAATVGATKGTASTLPPADMTPRTGASVSTLTVDGPFRPTPATLQTAMAPTRIGPGLLTPSPSPNVATLTATRVSSPTPGTIMFIKTSTTTTTTGDPRMGMGRDTSTPAASSSSSTAASTAAGSVRSSSDDATVDTNGKVDLQMQNSGATNDASEATNAGGLESWAIGVIAAVAGLVVGGCLMSLICVVRSRRQRARDRSAIVEIDDHATMMVAHVEAVEVGDHGYVAVPSSSIINDLNTYGAIPVPSDVATAQFEQQRQPIVGSYHQWDRQNR